MPSSLCQLTVVLLMTTVFSAPAFAASGALTTRTPSAGPLTLEALLANAKSSMPVDPAAAGRSAEAAEALTIKMRPSQTRTISVATALWLQAESLIRRNKAAAAAGRIETAIKLVGAIEPPIRLQGDLLQARAGIQDSLGRPEAALEDYQRGYAIFRKTGPDRSKAVALQNIGLLYLEANDLSKFFYYYKLAEETVPDDPLLNLSGSINKAGALYAAKRYTEAEAEYRHAYAIAVSLHDAVSKVPILSNLARSQAALGKLDDADATVAQAMKAWQSGRSVEMIPFLLETRADLALDENHTVEAVRFVEQALALVGDAAASQSNWQLQFTAYRAYAQAGQSAKALAHYEVYNNLTNQSRALAASISAAFSAAQFDFANQNARIATLKAGQLERDIALARSQAGQKLILLGGLLLIAIFIAAVLAFYLRLLRRNDKALREVNVQLTTVNVELLAALAAKSEFLATTSHEIRTPLNGILGMTQVLLADPALTDAVRERISLMQGAGEMLRALLDDILDFAKMGNSKLELHPLETDLSKLLNEIVGFWRDRASQQKLFLAVDFVDVPERVLIDSRRLRQILTNLLSNAIKFTAEGSIKVTVTTAMRSDDKAPDHTSERLRIAVTDTGIGIAETDHEAVFEKFRQLDSTTTRRFTGTGLGLAISRMIAQAMDGDISLESVVEVGSTFTLDLPLSRVASAPPMLRAARPSTLATARLALVGATPIAQGVLRAVLTPRVGSFTVATDIAAAVEQITAHAVDVIVIDAPAPLDTTIENDMEAQATRIASIVSLASAAGVAVAVLLPPHLLCEHARLLAAGAAIIGKPVTSSGLMAKLTALFENVDVGMVSEAPDARRGGSRQAS